MTMDIWEDLEPLRLDPTMGPEIITMGAPGNSPAAAGAAWTSRSRSWPNTLPATAIVSAITWKSSAPGLRATLARDRRRGRFLVDVLLPNFAMRRTADKRQMQLPGAWTEGVRDIDEFLRRHPEDLTAGC